jgi:hypothetical protein
VTLDTGATGATGPTGPAGPQGPAGAKGVAGPGYGVHYLTFGGSDFQPIRAGYDYTAGGAMGDLSLNSGTSGMFAAKVNLPDGAVIQAFSAFLKGSANVTLDLQYMTGGYATIATLGPTQPATIVNYTSLSTTTWVGSNVIDNSQQAYLIWVYAWGPFSLRGVNIQYNLPTPS